MQEFSEKHNKLFLRLNTPAKVQDFLNGIPTNFEKRGETCKSPLFVMQTNTAHCMEGAMLGAHILSLHGHKPLLLLLKGSKGDYDHIVVPFKVGKYWGALSKTNHAVLRYREPVYANVRELVMSYFHEYFKDNGVKTLVGYAGPLDLGKFGKKWLTSSDDLWHIDHSLDKIKLHSILPKGVRLRNADLIEREAGKITEWGKDGKRKK